MPTIAHVRPLAILRLAALLVLAVTAKVGAAQTPPNAAPPAATKGRSGVSKLNSQQKGKEPQQTDSGDSQIATCKECLCRCPVEQPHAQSEEEKAKAASLDRLYRRYMLATIVGVGAGIVGAVFLIWSTVLTRRAANAALMNAEALFNAERPWLAVLIEERGPDQYEISAKNLGRTPALVIGVSRVRVITESRSLSSDVPEYPEGMAEAADLMEQSGNLWMLAPNERWVFGTIDFSGSRPAILTAAEASEIRHGSKNLFHYGRIRYRDVFKRDALHETLFCFRFTEKGFLPFGQPGYNKYT